MDFEPNKMVIEGNFMYALGYVIDDSTENITLLGQYEIGKMKTKMNKVTG